MNFYGDFLCIREKSPYICIAKNERFLIFLSDSTYHCKSATCVINAFLKCYINSSSSIRTLFLCVPLYFFSNFINFFSFVSHTAGTFTLESTTRV